METVAHYYHASPLLANYNQREKPNHHEAAAAPAMTFRLFRSDILHHHQHHRLTLSKRVYANASENGSPFRDSRVSCFDGTTTIGTQRMATKTDQAAIEGKNMEKKQEERESKKSQPPPPEKPEPGDCCGSGCVRCVWDVYYEELEAYDKLYVKNPDPNNPKSD